MDLIYHFIGGFLIALIIVWLTRVKPLWMLSDKTVIIAGFSGLAAGVLKEIVIDWFIRQVPIEVMRSHLYSPGGIHEMFL